jgi:hypothetical protein
MLSENGVAVTPLLSMPGGVQGSVKHSRGEAVCLFLTYNFIVCSLQSL